MIHFAYPNAKIMPSEFIGCGRYIASEHQPDKYKVPSKIYNKSKVEAAAEILAYESFKTKKLIYEKSNQRYLGESKNLAYLLALISRSRELRLETDTDIWCTGSIHVTEGKPSLKSVDTNVFEVKLRQGFLSDENQDTLFIVPEANFLPSHQKLCEQKNVNVVFIEQFRKQYTDYDLERKTILRVRSDSDELFALTSLVFKMGPNPYKGLEYFDEKDADRFFGREDVIQEIWNSYQNISTYPTRLISIIGPSGSGKSSIVRAGITPKIRLFPKNPLILFRPGNSPLLSLTEGIVNLEIFDRLGHTGKAKFKDTILEQLKHGGLSEVVETLLERKIIPAPIAIIVDQFEEIYSLCDDNHERNQFIKNLLSAASAAISVFIVLRTDFLQHTYSHPELSNAIAQKTIIVPAMLPNNLRTVIIKPARRAGYLFGMEIVVELIDQTKGALPLLEFALSAIWQGMEKGITPKNTLEAINGVGGALANKAEELYNSLDKQDQHIAKRIFLSLTLIGEGIFDTRRRARLSEIIGSDDPDHVRKVLEIFSSPGARIITLSADSERRETAEITHEALFQHWVLLKDWINDERDNLRFHRRLSEAVKHWVKHNRPNGLLWRSPDLDMLQKFYEIKRNDMKRKEIEFFQKSIQVKQKEEKEKEVIRQRELKLLKTLAEEQSKLAEEQRRRTEAALKLKSEQEEKNAIILKELKTATALSQEKTKLAEEQAKSAQKLRLLLAKIYWTNAINAMENNEWLKSAHFFANAGMLVNSVRIRKNCIFNIQNLIKAFCVSNHMRNTKSIHDINHVVDNGEDKNLKLSWSHDEVKVEHKGTTLTMKHKGRVCKAISNKDKSLILSWTTDEVRVWHKDGTLAAQPIKQEKPIRRVFFDKDNMILIYNNSGDFQRWYIDIPLTVTAFSKKNSIIESITNSLRVFTTRQTLNYIKEAIVSNDGNRILIWGERELRLWNKKDGIVHSMTHDREIKKAVFNNNGSLILSWDADEIKLWNTSDGSPAAKPIKPEKIFEVIFYKDESMIMCLSKGKISLWNIADGTMTAESLPINDRRVAFSKDQKLILSWSGDKVKVWKTKHCTLMKHDGIVEGAMFSKNGGLILSWGLNTINLNTRDGLLLSKPMKHESVKGAMFSKDEGLILSWGSNIINLWNTNDGSPASNPMKHEGVVDAIFNKNSRLILSRSNDKIILWNTKDATLATQPIKHNIKGAIFNKDDRIIISWCHDGTLRLWHTYDGTPAGQIMKHGDSIAGVKLNKYGNKIMSWSEDGNISLWNIEADYDFPKEYLTLLLEVATGTVLDSVGNVIALNYEQWQKKKQEYIENAEVHFEICRYKHSNLYAKQEQFWEKHSTEEGEQAVVADEFNPAKTPWAISVRLLESQK